MTASRLGFRLLATAASTAAATSLLMAGSASAAPWVGHKPLTTPGTLTFAPTVAATPEGTVVAAWVQTDAGHVRAYTRTRQAASRSWGEPTPVSTDGVEVSPYTLRAVSSDRGDVVVVWTRDDNSAAYASVLEHGDDTWQDPEPLTTDPGTTVTGGAMAAGPDGTVGVLIATVTGGNHVVVLRTRRADGSIAAAVPVSEVSTDMNTELALSYAPNGRAVAAWRTNLAGDDELRVARADESGAWLGQYTVFADGADFGMTSAAITSGGKAAVFWTVASGLASKAAFFDGTSWALQNVSEGGEGGMLTAVRATADGRFVLSWQGMTLSDPYTTARPYTRIFDPGAGSWAGPRSALIPSLGGAPVLTGNRRGDMLVSALSTQDGSTFVVMGAVRPAGAGVFESADVASGGLPVGTDYGVPIAAMDDLGNGYIVFNSNSAEVGFAVTDRSAPEITGLTLPDDAVAGRNTAVSASAEDLWSEATVAWDFGDGATATGPDAQHAYAAAGSYTVTATASDTAGNQSSATGTITVAAPPSPQPAAKTEPKPAQTLAPVIEARLSGRTVTLNAKVTLKRGQKCQGTITATTAFGGKSYKAPAKLALKDGACRATAKITLKKTPSLRTKLRITVGTTKADKKKIGSRTVTSRRG